MNLMPVDPDHRQNRRDDGETDYAALKAKGLVRSKHGRILRIDEPKNKWSALQRDQLYQSFCEMMKAKPSERFIRQWIEDHAKELDMSVWRAIDIINEGNGQSHDANMQWWRGVSLP
jgi:hypothetical protein